MSRTPKVPKGARRVTTYEEFGSYVRDFADGKEPFLWVVGRPGLSKTETIRAATQGRQVWYVKGGRITQAAFYCGCFQHRGRPIILDDAEGLLEDKSGVKHVMNLAETNKRKQMSYGTTAKTLGDVPPVFYTSSPLCVIANKVTVHDAVMSRASALLFFDPTNVEVHRAAASWFWDQEIFDWFGRNLDKLEPVDVRWYVTSAKDKRNGRDWRKIRLEASGIDRATSIVQELSRIPDDKLTEEERATKYVEQMGGEVGASRRTYFRIKARLEKLGQLQPSSVGLIDLGAKEPEDIDQWELDRQTEELLITGQEPPAPQAAAANPEKPTNPKPHPLKPPMSKDEFANVKRGPLSDDSLPWEK